MKFPRILFLLWLALASGVLFSGEKSYPDDSDEFSGRKVADREMANGILERRRFNPPERGEKALNFSVVDLKTGESKSLEQIQGGKPLVLVFGSYGCDVLRVGMDRLRELHREFGDRFDFAMIYIREAHSLNGFRPEAARAEDPLTMAERLSLAEKGRAGMDIPFPIYVDSIDDRVATCWGAWPVRIFVLGTDRTVLYCADTGPWGFNPGLGFEPARLDSLEPRPDRFSEESLEEFLRHSRRPAG